MNQLSILYTVYYIHAHTRTCMLQTLGRLRGSEVLAKASRTKHGTSPGKTAVAKPTRTSVSTLSGTSWRSLSLTVGARPLNKPDWPMCAFRTRVKSSPHQTDPGRPWSLIVIVKELPCPTIYVWHRHLIMYNTRSMRASWIRLPFQFWIFILVHNESRTDLNNFNTR